MIEVAVFGAGRIGKIHAGNVARHPQAHLRYVVDVHEPSAKELAGKHGAKVASVEEAADGTVVANLKSNKRVSGDALLYSIGRQGNVDDLNLAAAGLTADNRGRIQVDEQYRTAQPHILAVGDVIRFGEEGKVCFLSELDATVEDKGEEGEITLSFAFHGPVLDQAIAERGEVPLPPYIASRRPADERDRADYQTLFARQEGAVAAPTAGLHFTPELLARLDAVRVTLHVGLDTFRPVTEERLEEHRIHGERYEVEPDTWERIRTADRVLAVGTTTVRVVETLARGGPLSGRTELFITPGFEFRRVDALLTNFHLPRSTLLALVMAFAGVDEIRELYALAIAERYRFYSFGDAMLIL